MVMSKNNIELRISILESKIDKLKNELRTVGKNELKRSRLVDEINLKKGEINGLKWCLK